MANINSLYFAYKMPNMGEGPMPNMGEGPMRNMGEGPMHTFISRLPLHTTSVTSVLAYLVKAECLSNAVVQPKHFLEEEEVASQG